MSEESAAQKQWRKVVAILFVAIVSAYLLNAFKPAADKKTVKASYPPVEIIQAQFKDVSIPVISQGSIKARTRIKLVAEVSGRVTELAKLKNNGGFFKQGDWLLSIDDTDYRLAMSRAQAQVAAAKQQFIRVKTEADQAKYDLRQIGRDPSKSSSYALREPQLAEAKANLQAAQADLEIARLQMQRTKVLAPFDGRVVSKQVDVGQYVSAGSVLAEIYSTDSVTIRLPLTLRQAQLLNLGLYENKYNKDNIKIILMADSAEKHYQWDARLSHVEGEVDSRNRLIYVVAEVKSPYAKETNKPPLTPGMFVKAELKGVEKKAIKIPRGALRFDNHVWLLTENNRLKIKAVSVLSKTERSIYIESGIETGDQVIVNAIDFPVDGMRLLLVKAGEQQQEKLNHG